jgi:hypothetical protein
MRLISSAFETGLARTGVALLHQVSHAAQSCWPPEREKGSTITAAVRRSVSGLAQAKVAAPGGSICQVSARAGGRANHLCPRKGLCAAGSGARIRDISPGRERGWSDSVCEGSRAMRVRPHQMSRNHEDGEEQRVPPRGGHCARSPVEALPAPNAIAQRTCTQPSHAASARDPLRRCACGSASRSASDDWRGGLSARHPR